MARYIDAEKLEEALRVDYDREGKKSYTYAAIGDDDLAVKYSHGQFCYLNAMERVKDAPTADVAPRAEVAREIFEEIDKIIEKHHSECYEYEDGDECDTAITYISYLSVDIADLKNKYTEGLK